MPRKLEVTDGLLRQLGLGQLRVDYDMFSNSFTFQLGNVMERVDAQTLHDAIDIPGVLRGVANRLRERARAWVCRRCGDSRPYLRQRYEDILPPPECCGLEMELERLADQPPKHYQCRCVELEPMPERIGGELKLGGMPSSYRR